MSRSRSAATASRARPGCRGASSSGSRATSSARRWARPICASGWPRAMALMRETALPTIAVAAACGFTSASHFSRSFRRRYGIRRRRRARQRWSRRARLPRGRARACGWRVRSETRPTG
ncbi:MAG: helix-turn-helix domain-containing protein [Sphingomonas sp.]